MSPVATFSVGGMLESAELSGETAELDAELLLSHVLRRDRSWVIANPASSVSREQAADFTSRVRRRAAGCPVAYLTGRKEFFGRDFLVTPDVLVPRPDSETLVTAALKRLRTGDTVIDVGTGSGCLAVTMALEAPRVPVLATDSAPAALRIASANARRLEAAVTFSPADLLPQALPAAERSVVLANLPYVTDADYAKRAGLRFEPAVALRGGKDGLDLIRRLFEQLAARAWQPRELLLEIDPAQAVAVKQLASGRVSVQRDLAGRDRVVIVSRTR